MSFAVFSDNNHLLAPFCKPYADELLSSWLTRMSFYQGLSPRELGKLIWPQNAQNADLDQFISDLRLQVLKNKTNCSFHQLYATSLRSYNLAGNKSMITEPVYEACTVYDIDKKREVTRHHYRSGLMFCPNCLKKNSYFKKEWRLTISLVCPVCKCYLLDRCPHCLRYYDFMRKPNAYHQCNSLCEFLITCRYCNKDITACPENFAQPPVIALQRQLYAVLQTEKTSHSFKRSYFKILLDLASFLQVDKTRAIKINNFVRKVMQINGFQQNHLSRYTEKITKLSPEKRMPFISMAQWLMEGWPYRLLSLCMEYSLHWRDILPAVMKENAALRDPLVDDLAYRIEDMTEMVDTQLTDESDIITCGRNIRKLQKFNCDYDFDFDTYYYDNEDDDCDALMRNAYFYKKCNIRL